MPNLVPGPSPVEVELPAPAGAGRLRILDDCTADAVTHRPHSVDGTDVGVTARGGVVQLDLDAAPSRPWS